jgi:4-hydroxy 2-oxovalerate aldolase
MTAVHILETTIRDGSYEVGFQFTRQDVAILAGLLDQAGFSYIEIGHGNGLGGEVFGETAAASDDEYMETARRAVARAKLGALLGFTKRDDEQILGKVRAAARNGLDFLRMGFVPARSDAPIILKSIELARELGLTVSVNLMRTYCAPPDEVAERCARLRQLGVDWYYVVDSAGGMTATEVKAYVRALLAAGAPVVGFHGHNNTQSALANSLAAIEAGACLVDTSLQGLGRATGNAQTEVLLTILQVRHGLEREVDRGLVYRLARRYVQPLMEPGLDPTHVLAGALNVHSSCLPQLEESARSSGLDLDAVLARAGGRAAAVRELDKRDLPTEIVRTSCEELAEAGAPTYDLRSVAAHAADYQAGPPNDLADLFARLFVLAQRDHLRAALVLPPRSLWPFDGMGVVRRQGWAFGVVPVESIAEVDLGAHLPQSWLAQIFAADRLAGGEALAGLAPTTWLSYPDLIGEAVAALGARLPTAVAIDGAELRAAVVGRLSGCPDLRVLGGDGRIDLSRARARHLVVEGALGARALASVTGELGPGDTVSVLGPSPVGERALAGLRASGARVRLPDPFPLLIARLAMCDRVELVEGTSEDLLAALDSPSGSAVAWAGHVIDSQSGTQLGSWRAARPRGAEPTGARREAAFAAHLARLRRLVQ